MNDDSVSFLGGFLMAVLGRIDWIIKLHHFLQVQFASDMAWQWFIKVTATFILGFIGGVAGLLAKWFVSWLKSKFDKSKK